MPIFNQLEINLKLFHTKYKLYQNPPYVLYITNFYVLFIFGEDISLFERFFQYQQVGAQQPHAIGLIY